MLLECLNSLRRQSPTEEWVLESIIVVWNQSAQDASTSTQQLNNWLQANWDSPVLVRQVHETERGIPFARNRGIAEVISRDLSWFVFIDDDCVAQDGWLEELTRAATPVNVDVVAGGWSIEPAGSPSSWLPREVFGTKNYLANGADAVENQRLEVAYTRNVLVKIPCLTLLSPGQPYFDPAAAQRGGSDVLFFSRLHRLGARIIYAPAAQVRELYRGERLRLRWHLMRRIRNTQLRLSRRAETGENLGEGIRAFSSSLDLLWRLPMTILILPLSPLFPAFRHFIGDTALRCVPYLAVALHMMGIHYREYAD